MEQASKKVKSTKYGVVSQNGSKIHAHMKERGNRKQEITNARRPSGGQNKKAYDYCSEKLAQRIKHTTEQTIKDEK